MKVRWIKTRSQGDRVALPDDGLVYSTDPYVVMATDKSRYYCKDKQVEIVQAECICYALAEEVQLTVPEFALCKLPRTNATWFASQEVAFRSAVDVLVEAGACTNRGMLADCVAFDVWVANHDRNMGGVIAQAAVTGNSGDVELVFIDFEKSRVLRGESELLINMKPATDYWPSGSLGVLCKGLPYPTAMCARIRRLTDARIRRILQEIFLAIGAPSQDKQDSITRTLLSRAAKIETLVNETWNA